MIHWIHLSSPFATTVNSHIPALINSHLTHSSLLTITYYGWKTS